MPGLYINSIWFKTFKSWDLKGKKAKGGVVGGRKRAQAKTLNWKHQGGGEYDCRRAGKGKRERKGDFRSS